MKLESKLSFDKIYNSENLVDELDDSDKKQIAQDCLEGYRIDQDSRKEWDKIVKEVLKIAKQETEPKNTPYKESANIKLPLLNTAALQFSSRAVTEFIKNGRVANNAIVGSDPTGELAQAAKRTSDHMSWQMLVQSPSWEKDFDASMSVLPIYGTIFKKTYYDPFLKLNCSDLCLPEHIAVNQNINNLKSAARITHLIYQTKNEIVSNIRSKYYSDISEELEKEGTTVIRSSYLPETESDKYDMRDNYAPRPIIEQHRFLDLDGDGYEEPYIVTVDIGSEKLLRIVRRFDGDGVSMDSDGDIVRIEAINYFTDYHFLPSPDGTFWSMGYGQLLFPINHAANSLANLIIDTGRRNASASGIMSKLPGMTQGTMALEPNTFKVLDVPAAGVDFSKSVLMTPPVNVSPVLYQTLGMMLEQGKEVASVTDMLQGKQEGQNMPATTAVSLVQQGLAVYNSIIKRIYRALKSELEKWYRLNALYLDDEVYFTIMNNPMAVKRTDYSLVRPNVYPAADPSLSSDAQRLARAQAIWQAMPGLSPQAQGLAKQLYFEALQVPDQQVAILASPPMAPPPDAVKVQAESELLQAKALSEQMKARTSKLEALLHYKDLEIKQYLAQLKAIQVKHSAEKSSSQADLNYVKEQNAKELGDAQIFVDALKAVDPEKGLSFQTVKSLVEEKTNNDGTNNPNK